MLQKFHILGEIIVCVWVLAESDQKQKYTVKVSQHSYPDNIIAQAIARSCKAKKLTQEAQQRCIQEHITSYLLKVCGTDEYLLSPAYPICQYKVGALVHLMIFFLSKKYIYIFANLIK